MRADRATEDREQPLATLGDSEFKLAEGEPDVRGWSLVGCEGRPVGSVSELIVDPAALKVRYLDCELREGPGGAGARHVLIPIGYARFEKEAENVIVDAISEAQIAGLPRFTGLPVRAEVEERIHAAFTGSFEGR